MLPRAQLFGRQLRFATVSARCRPTPRSQIKTKQPWRSRTIVTIPYDTALQKGQIRLLRVTSTEDDGAGRPAVVCTQKIVELASNPEYYALSYTWDLPYKDIVWENDKIMELTEDWDPEDAPRDYKFVVDGKELWMTPNMFWSLSVFMDVASESWIWIDAICIRQDDETEKAMQVQAMKDVYASAIAVLISLGREECTFPHGSMDDVLEVVDCFVPRLRKAIAADNHILHALEPASLADASFEAKVGIDSLGKKMMAFAEFCTIFRWFSRLWCIQEVVLARAITVRCGKRSVSWDAMEELVSLLRYQDWDTWLAKGIAKSTGYGGSHLAWCGGLVSMCVLRTIVHSFDRTSAAYRRIRLRGTSDVSILTEDESKAAQIQGASPVSHPLKKPTKEDPSSFSLCADLLTQAQSTACSNELDRVYGFLGVFDAIVAEDVSTLIAVDYTESVSSLYLKVMMLLMEKSGTIDLVAIQFPEDRDQQQQSSWVFDLRRPFPKSRVRVADGNSASRGIKEVFKSTIGQVPPFTVCHEELHVFGGNLDRISHVFSDGRILNVMEKLAEVLPSKISKRPCLDSVWRTLIQNQRAILKGQQQAGLELENHFLAYIVLEAVYKLAVQDKEKKLDRDILETHISYFANILSQFDFADGSGDRGHDYHVSLLRQSLLYACEMNELNRESMRHYQHVWAELLQLEIDGGITTAKRENALRNMQIRGDDNIPPQLIQLSASFSRSMTRGMSPERVLFVSEKGLLGSAPKSTQVGDSIWILCGATAPWVLRPAQKVGPNISGTSPDDERYTFVGDTFILDMMNGEALQREEFGLRERLRRVTIV